MANGRTTKTTSKRTSTDRRRIAVYFDGFRPIESRPGPPHAYSTWIASLLKKGPLEGCFVNAFDGGRDSLVGRWKRAEPRIRELVEAGAEVHVLGYSMGCHLAVKFVRDVLASPRGASSPPSFGPVYLIGPDPKFAETDLDKSDPPSAHDEAKALWQVGGDHPGPAFSAAVRALVQQVVQVRVLSSRLDTIATWDGNVELFEREVASRVDYSLVDLRTSSERPIACTLRPERAQNEFWIHEQLFTMTEIGVSA